MERVLLAVALIAVAATVIWAATPGAYTLKVSHCYNASTTNCSFSKSPSGTVQFDSDGSGWEYLPGDTSAHFFPPGSVSTTDEAEVPCPNPYFTYTCHHMVVQPFSTRLYTDRYSLDPTAQTLSGGDSTTDPPTETGDYFVLIASSGGKGGSRPYALEIGRAHV